MKKRTFWIFFVSILILSCNKPDRRGDITGTWSVVSILPEDTSLLKSPSGGSALIFLNALSSNTQFTFQSDSFWINTKWSGFYSSSDSYLYGLNFENKLERATFSFSKDTLFIKSKEEDFSPVVIKLHKR